MRVKGGVVRSGSIREWAMGARGEKRERESGEGSPERLNAERMDPSQQGITAGTTGSDGVNPGTGTGGHRWPKRVRRTTPGAATGRKRKRGSEEGRRVRGRMTRGTGHTVLKNSVRTGKRVLEDIVDEKYEWRDVGGLRPRRRRLTYAWEGNRTWDPGDG